MRQLWRAVWPVGVLALLCAVFYWDVLWLPGERIIAANDLSNMFLQWFRFALSSVEHGHLPLWNPYLFSGVPFVANPQPALFYPPTWLALLMPTTRALSWIIVLHLWLAGVGMYSWLRAERASVAGALLAGTVFAFSGYFFVRVYAGHLGVISTGAWLPIVLWLYRSAVTRRSWALAVVGGLPVGLSILAGHTATFVYVALGLVAYAVFCAREHWQEECSVRAAVFPVVTAGVMFTVGLALAAVQLLPTVELVLHSTRQADPSYDFAARFSWSPGYLLTLLVPNFFGEPTRTGYWGDGIYDEFIFYIGVLPLMLALLGLRVRHRLTRFLFALGLGALLLAFGEHAVVHRLFFRFVPLFQMARAPARAGFLFTLAATALAGLTITALQSSTCEDRGRLLASLRSRLVLAVAGGTVALAAAGFAVFALLRDTNPAAGQLWHLANRLLWFVLLFLLSAGLLRAWRDAPHIRTGLLLLTLGLVLLDLWTFGSGAVSSADVRENSYWHAVAEAVDDPEAARVLPWGLGAFEHNGGMAFGLRSVFGYDPLVLQRYEEFFSSQPDPLARTYDLLNAGYLVTSAQQEFAEQPDGPRLLLEKFGTWVYERPNALPRAWLASEIEVVEDGAMLARIHEPDFDPRTTALVSSAPTCEGGMEEPGEVRIVRYEGNRIEARVRGGGGLLIFSELDYPGWRATVDGEPARLVRADYVLRALCVPAGERRVALVYDPPLLKLGLAITASTLVVLIGAAIFGLTGRTGRWG